MRPPWASGSANGSTPGGLAERRPSLDPDRRGMRSVVERYEGTAARPDYYMRIFEANLPMLTYPDKIYPGQLLRIPPA